MNSIRQIQELNKRELEAGVSPEASWHSDYRDTAYIYIGGLPFELSEGDIITIFSQYGEPTFVNLVRDKETGKSKGFAFLKYEDQRSTDLAVDNLGGTTIMNRTLRVDHTRYKKKDDEPEEAPTSRLAPADTKQVEQPAPQQRAPMLKEERELMALMEDHDDDDPMKDFLIKEKKEEIAAALAKSKDQSRSSRDGHRRHHHHHRSHRSRSRSRERSHRHSRHDRSERDENTKSRSHSSRHDDRRDRADDRRTHHSRDER